MTPLKSGINLLDNETLIAEVDAGLYITSAFVILRFIQGFLRFIGLIFGFRKRGYLVITNKRFVEVYDQIIFWVLKIRKNVRSVPLCAIKKDVGCVKKGTFAFLFRSYQLYYERFWRRVYAVLRGLDEGEAYRITNAAYKALNG
jgi:hypothetical protein